ncbi:hypothetical protein ACIPVK_16860 [Paeniglutamicibacter sp. MACA_103]|uniref:hypothetical protein n=1 Tax=Paeniglutamicibacter sp. MACA_103 TaxID=3377337 RepID=UPI003895496A
MEYDMFNNQIRTFPRAYVGAGMEPSEALKTAMGWVRPLISSWSEVSILVPRISQIDEDRTLSALRKSGAHFSQPRNHSANSVSRGPWIAYCPTRDWLVGLEKENSKTALVATMWTENDVRAWVDAYEPECLGGDGLRSESPEISHPVFWQAMDDFTVIAYGGATIHDTRDAPRIIDGLKKLKASGYLPSDNGVLAAALKKNWQGKDALVLAGYVNDIHRGVNKRVPREYELQSDIVSQWEIAAQA